ncbi:alpha-glucosidase [Paenarthrobacter sp. NPDC092416]|uniref:glycoside hydrolase family 13 protein n=1 Tax=Paenarthrobacter sp. NPDC092416 TaxID=3364386 RepID=UPI0037FAFAEF
MVSECTPDAGTPTAAPHGHDASGNASAPDPGWFKSAVVYQVYPRSFCDSNGDGVGDLQGIIGKLDYLHALGVDVLWLCPVYVSPQDDNGYDISDYRDIDPVFGSLQDMDTLIDGLHLRGIKLIMDLVVNHTSDEHPWFVESRSSLENPKRDWYWWRSGSGDASTGNVGAEPNNWGSAFSGPAWEFDQKTGQYYLHLFSKKQPDLNWENPDVRDAIHEMMNWWLDRGVDGFRMDVINFISKDPDLPDGLKDPTSRYADGSPHYVGGPRVHEFLQEIHRKVFEHRSGQMLTVGEMPGVSIEDAVLFTDSARKELDMIFQFDHMTLDMEGGNKWLPKVLRLTDLKASLGRWQEGLADGGWNSLFWGNHDSARAVSRFGDDGNYREQSAKMLAGVLHLHRGTPYVYQGEELGMTNMDFDLISEHRDIEALNYHREATTHGAQNDAEVLAALKPLNRDNARTPFHWNATADAGFSTGLPWMGVNPNAVQINAETQISDPGSVFHFYRRLIELRHKDPVVSQGDFTMLLPEDECIYAFIRSLAGMEMLVLGNFSGSDVAAAIGDDSWAHAEQVLGNYPAVPSLGLRPWELKVFRRCIASRRAHP